MIATPQHPDLSLPSIEFKVTFGDGSVSVPSVHANQTLEGALSEMLRALRGGADDSKVASASDADVRSVELMGTLELVALGP